MEPNEPLFQNIDCVRLYVTDLSSGLSFYRDHLGLNLVWKTKSEAGLKMPNDITEIVLCTEKKNPEIDLKVKSADDAAMQIKEAGGNVLVPPFDIRIGRCVVVNDPWGNELVLLDTTKGLLKTDPDGNVIGNEKTSQQ